MDIIMDVVVDDEMVQYLLSLGWSKDADGNLTPPQ